MSRLGQIRDRAYKSQLHRARGLDLLVAAIALWNSRYLGEAVTALRRHGCNVPDQLLTHVWPLAWAHINLTGDYTWRDGATRDLQRLRDLQLDQLPPSLPLQRAAWADCRTSSVLTGLPARFCQPNLDGCASERC